MPKNQKDTNLADSGDVPVNRYVVFLVITVLGCTADLLTKHYTFAWLGMPGENPPYWIVEPYFGIETALNTGALFGMGQNKPWLFAGLSFVAAAGILYWLLATKAARDLLLTIALSLIMGGILGNLYDRLGMWGGQTAAGQTIYAVRDWVLFRYGEFTWPNFNIADVTLVCGACTLVLHAFMQPKPDGPAADASDS